MESPRRSAGIAAAGIVGGRRQKTATLPKMQTGQSVSLTPRAAPPLPPPPLKRNNFSSLSFRFLWDRLILARAQPAIL